MPTTVTTNINDFLKDFEAADQARIKAGQTAVKVEGYRLMRLLQGELRAGAPGGSQLAPLREITQWSGRRSPLARLINAVRYNADGGHVEIGATAARVSSNWRHIMLEQQTGTTVPVTEERRQALRQIGAALLGRGRKGDADRAKYFFLRKDTTEFKVPARDIIDVFWGAHEAEVMPNIQDNFARKMGGERI